MLECMNLLPRSVAGVCSARGADTVFHDGNEVRALFCIKASAMWAAPVCFCSGSCVAGQAATSTSGEEKCSANALGTFFRFYILGHLRTCDTCVREASVSSCQKCWDSPCAVDAKALLQRSFGILICLVLSNP